MKKPVALIIMDGFGESNSTIGNAVKEAKTPNLDRKNLSNNINKSKRS